ncbi:MAG TPA: DUF1285 domain-containing protein [Gammaproteobacteria bacterium]|nr:DUF1285 domain-containing protein [Gammaproteobacteria bacterium]
MADIEQLFDTLLSLQQQKRLPPLEQWQPDKRGEVDIRIDRDGRWFHEGDQIKRQPLIDLFATLLRKEGDDYFLVTPVEQMRIEVEDSPFLVIDMDVRGQGEDTDLLFTTNVGDYVLADAAHEVFMIRDTPYFSVRDNLLARIQRSVFYRLVEVGVERDGALWIHSQGTAFNLGSLT